MAVNYNFKRGVDLPSWHWLNQTPTASIAGFSSTYDGARFIYYAAAGMGLYRFDIWTNGWQYLSSSTISAAGGDVEYDPVRNVIWLTVGNIGTNWYFFNLNTTALTLFGSTAQPFAISAAIAVALPVAATTGGSLAIMDDSISQAPLDGYGRTVGVTAVGSTATSILDAPISDLQPGMVGSYVRYTSGALSGQQRVITAVPNLNGLTTAAFTAAPAAGDTFVVDMPGGMTALAATAGTTTALTGAAAEAWPVNIYRDSDVVIVAGTGAGQRRRIASNTANVLTLAALTTGNARTGPFTTAPDATSTFRIVPSTDFAYYNTNTTAMYRCDLAATTALWYSFGAAMPAVPGAGSDSKTSPTWAPFSIIMFRGAGTSSVWRLDVGLQTWATLPSFWGIETLNAGGGVAKAYGRTRMIVHVGGTQRMYTLNVATGVLEPLPQPPYAIPTTVEGKHIRFIRSADGVDWIYWQRNGGQEFFRLPVEWL